MLFDLTVKIKAPGNSPDDALVRLRSKIPHWEIELIDAAPSEDQPAPITGVASIILPLPLAKGFG